MANIAIGLLILQLLFLLMYNTNCKVEYMKFLIRKWCSMFTTSLEVFFFLFLLTWLFKYIFVLIMLPCFKMLKGQHMICIISPKKLHIYSFSPLEWWSDSSCHGANVVSHFFCLSNWVLDLAQHFCICNKLWEQEICSINPVWGPAAHHMRCTIAPIPVIQNCFQWSGFADIFLPVKVYSYR